jgi:hypothetical protein
MKLEVAGELKIILIATMFLIIASIAGYTNTRFALRGEPAVATILEVREYPASSNNQHAPRIEVTYEFDDHGVARASSYWVPGNYRFNAQGTVPVRYIPGTDDSYIGENSPPWIFFALPVIAAIVFVWRLRKLYRVAMTRSAPLPSNPLTATGREG